VGGRWFYCNQSTLLLQYLNGSHTLSLSLMCLVYDQSTKKLIYLAWNNSSITANQHIMPNTLLNYINRHLLSFSQLNKTSKASFQIELAGCHSRNIYLFIYLFMVSNNQSPPNAHQDIISTCLKPIKGDFTMTSPFYLFVFENKKSRESEQILNNRGELNTYILSAINRQRREEKPGGIMVISKGQDNII